MKKLLIILLALGLITSSFNAEAVVKRFQKDAYTRTLTTGLVSYWKMEGDSTDFWGSNNGTDTAITYGSSYGKVNDGALFNGSSSVISFTDNAGWRPSGAFSVAGWIKTTSTNIGGVISNAIVNSGDYSGWVVTMNNTTNKLLFVIYPANGTTQNKTITSATSVNSGNWVHFVSVYDGTNMSLYINGSSDAGTLASGAPSYDATEAPKIGNYISTGTTYRYSGDLDEVGIWSKALSTTEISNLYNAGNGQTMCAYGTTCRIIQGSGITR